MHVQYICRLYLYYISIQVHMISFSIQNLPFTDPMLTVWAQLVNLAGSKLEKQRMKKSLSRGLTGTDKSITHLSPDVI